MPCLLGPRLLCTAVLLVAAWVVWHRPPGRRRTTVLTIVAVAAVEVMIGWMVPQVWHPEL